MDNAIRLRDIRDYIQRRRAYLLARRDAAGTASDKGKIIGMLQALVDFEGMLQQLRVNTGEGNAVSPIRYNPPKSDVDLAVEWLDALHLAGATLDDFRDDKRQNRMLVQYPEKKEGIMSLGKLLRNKDLIALVLDHLQSRAGEFPRICSPKPLCVSPTNGGTCPHCGKSYKYAKALDTHIYVCPKRPSSIFKDGMNL